MNRIDEEEQALLDELIKMEVDLITSCFKKSEELGKIAFSNSLNSFVGTYLEPKYKTKIITSMSTEYRYLLIGILSNIDSCYLPFLIKESIVPEYRNLTTEDLLKALLD